LFLITKDRCNKNSTLHIKTCTHQWIEVGNISNILCDDWDMTFLCLWFVIPQDIIVHDTCFSQVSSQVKRLTLIVTVVVVSDPFHQAMLIAIHSIIFHLVVPTIIWKTWMTTLVHQGENKSWIHGIYRPINKLIYRRFYL